MVHENKAKLKTPEIDPIAVQTDFQNFELGLIAVHQCSFLRLFKMDTLKFLLILPLNNEGIEKLFLLCEYFYVVACWILSRNPCDKYHIDKA